MVFPATKLPVKVELQLAGVWTDITAYARVSDKVTITRGRRDESGSFEPGECALVLNNQGGRFSPRNPTGPYYGLLTRNTPIRVSVAAGAPAQLAPVALDYFSAPDTAGLSITGDIDLRVDASIDGWDFTPGPILLSKNLTTGNQRSYRLGANSSAGNVFLGWSADGITEISAQSTVGLPQTTGRQTIRATLDVDNGAGGNTVTFYYGSSVAGPWTQLGAPVVTPGVTSIFNSTAEARVGFSNSALVENGMTVYAAEIRDGINGTLRGSPTFTAQTSGATSFADAQGNTWTAQGTAILSNRRYRFHGEVSSWPQEWDLSERDAWVSVQTAGILRRLGQGTAALKSSIQRFLTRATFPVFVYWPMEDSEGSTSIASGLAGGTPMTIAGGPPQFATNEQFLSSGPLLELGGASLSAPAGHSGGATVYVQWLMSIPQSGETSGIVMRLFTTGTAARWDVEYVAGGGGLVNVKAFDSVGAQLFSSGASFQVEGAPVSCGLQLVQNGANIDWALTILGYSVTAPGLGVHSGTLNSRTSGAASYIQINPNGTLDPTAVGHLYVLDAIPNGPAQIAALRGYAGEVAARRIERLCTEEGVTFTILGNLDNSAAMGVQKPAQLLDLLAECEAADLGQLFESREQLGLIYRPRASRAAQYAVLALNYAALQGLAPVEDDQSTRNDVTVTRTDGSSARATVDVGPLSTQAPPNGVGRYDDSIELNLAADSQLADQANLRAAIGTIDEPRYPVISAQLAGTAFAASQALTSSALDVDAGDLITVTGTPVWLPPGTVRQHTIGQVETLGVREYQIDFVCEPATPVGSAGVYDSTAMRWAADGSTLNAPVTSTATGAAALSLVTPAGRPLWTSDPTDFPMDVVVGGERITLSAIAATASPQSATVSARSANGVVKAHSAGAEVQIADPFYWAL